MDKSLKTLLLEELKRLEINHYHDVWPEDMSFLRIRSDEKGERRLSVEFMFNAEGDKLLDIELHEEVGDVAYKVSKKLDEPEEFKHKCYGISIEITDSGAPVPEIALDPNATNSTSEIHERRNELTKELSNTSDPTSRHFIICELMELDEAYHVAAQRELEEVKKGGSNG